MDGKIHILMTRWARPTLIVSAIWSVLCAAAMVFGWGGEGVRNWLAAWGSFPVSVAIAALMVPIIRDRGLTPRRRLAWQLVFVTVVLDLIASVAWGYRALTDMETFGSWPDVLYIFYYPCAAVACVLFFRELGGRLDSSRSIIDFFTVSIGFGLLLWFTALAPFADMTFEQFKQHWSVVGYGIGNAIALIAGAMLAMQITDWRAERPVVWLLVSMVVTLVADLLWINAELRGSYQLGSVSDVVYFIYYLALLVAVRTQLHQPKAVTVTQGLQGDLRGSLPIVALMSGAIALLDDKLELVNMQSPLLIIVGVVATLLVVASQAFATREVVGLHREVATRRFDERLTELVRRSSDMIAICDVGGIIRFASPSSEALLGLPAAEIAGQPLEAVLGREGPLVRAVFDDVARMPHSEQIASFTIENESGDVRSFKLVIANLCHVESIGGVTLNIRDVSDAARLNDQLRALAFHDPLTLLANRALFSDRVHDAIKHIADGMTPAVLFIDLDNFKTVNDSLGHNAGDTLLRSVAHRLVQNTRAGDTVARLGGDEFAILIDNVPEIGAAMAVASKVIEACKQPFDIDGMQLRVGCSIGVALSDRVSTVERLMRNADAAMYSAKSHGKGHAEVFEPEMLRAARRRMRVENELATAIDEGQFEAFYQPIVDLASRHLIGVEALMRWRHPSRGLVSPADFIPLAEETGQIVEMTRWMLNRACRDGVRLQKKLEHGTGLRVSVNVSSRYLNHGDVTSEVRAALLNNGLAPECLILEVTESLLIENSARLEKIFRELKLLGVHLALDDFGTGYSSLAYLHRFPIDILKIDRSFVERLSGAGAVEGVDAIALARAILSMADALGLDTVAEGIEVDEQRDTLMSLGCKTGQGYSFGKPMPIDELFDAAVTRRRDVLASNVASPVEYSATGRFRNIGDQNG